MSGGMAVKTVPGGGGSPGLHDRRETKGGRSGIPPGTPAAYAKGLVLMVWGVADPIQMHSAFSPNGLAVF
ncbi:hypothetical protein EV662_11714 [Rhodovulum marinum]|uniref:Uncharacterized protein n=1 Tax=Rhodovulum marinum TaxID=320662 RepID=A0A4R2PSD4_9RHOB|nr:hypothetical protein EV662_11714 [Rhodovulum marinum]